MGYGNLEHQFWEHDDLQELGLPCRAVAAYLITCRHASSEGYYRLSLGYLCDDLRLDRDSALAYLQALDLQEFARYDPRSQVVFLRNAMRWRPPRGPKSIPGALKKALEVPANPFRTAFYDAACTWAPEFAEALSLAGFASDGPIREPSLFPPEVLALPAPTPIAVHEATPADERIEQIMLVAAQQTVTLSMSRGEHVRNPSALARTRLGMHRSEWQPIVGQWMEMFPHTSDVDFARALADGGKASVYWKRAATP